MRFLKWIALLSGILAGIAAWFIAREKKEKAAKEMDAYLMESDSSDSPAADPASVLAKDILSWKDTEAENGPVILSFGFPDVRSAETFQNAAAADGYSSELDRKSLVVDILYNAGYSLQNLSELAEALSLDMTETGAQYHGFHFVH